MVHFYTIQRHKDVGYYDLNIRLYDGSHTGSGSEHLLEMHWQGNAGSEDRGWYAFTMTARVSDVDRLALATRLAKRIFSDNSSHWGTQPDFVLSRLSSLKIDRRVYDGRISQYVTVENVPDTDLLDWRDDWKSLGKPHCMAGGLARNEKEAQGVVEAELISENQYDYLAEWARAGKPVKQLNSNPAYFMPIDEIITPVGW